MTARDCIQESASSLPGLMAVSPQETGGYQKRYPKHGGRTAAGLRLQRESRAFEIDFGCKK
jgi:hypothetical protein